MNSQSHQREIIAQRTFLEHGERHIDTLCQGLGLPERARSMREVFRSLSHPWGGWQIRKQPRWYPSILSDDHAPYELSVTFCGTTPNTQLYLEAQDLEAQGAPPSLRSNMKAGLALLDEISNRHDVSLDRLHAIQDLFLPEDPQGLFTILFGITWREAAPPRFKVYLNPQVRGAAASYELLQTAMDRLDFGHAWSAVRAHTSSADPALDEPMYLCLDLTSHAHARVKVYRRHYQATAHQVDEIAQVAASYHVGDAIEFFGVLSEHEGAFLSKPVITSLVFTEAVADRPSSVTLAFPLSSYVENDRVASERIVRCLGSYGLDPAPYRKMIARFAERPLEAANGIHAHASLKRQGDAPCVTVYLATEAYEVERLQWPSKPG
jgi:DMATS type aromatic prenyltransferase